MIRVSTVDILDGKLDGIEDDVWIDHVMFDICNSMLHAVENMKPNIKAITVHENAFLLRHKYSELFDLCDKKGIKIVMAKRDTYERVSPCGGMADALG